MCLFVRNRHCPQNRFNRRFKLQQDIHPLHSIPHPSPPPHPAPPFHSSPTRPRPTPPRTISPPSLPRPPLQTNSPPTITPRNYAPGSPGCCTPRSHSRPVRQHPIRQPSDLSISPAGKKESGGERGQGNSQPTRHAPRVSRH